MPALQASRASTPPTFVAVSHRLALERLRMTLLFRFSLLEDQPQGFAGRIIAPGCPSPGTLAGCCVLHIVQGLKAGSSTRARPGQIVGRWKAWAGSEWTGQGCSRSSSHGSRRCLDESMHARFWLRSKIAERQPDDSGLPRKELGLGRYTCAARSQSGRSYAVVRGRWSCAHVLLRTRPPTRPVIRSTSACALLSQTTPQRWRNTSPLPLTTTISPRLPQLQHDVPPRRHARHRQPAIHG